jgi:hypothetical protein
LQKGTSPLVKLMDGIATRNFTNFKHSDIQDGDFVGERAILNKEFKLVMHGGVGEDDKKELFNIRQDPSESNKLIADESQIAHQLEKQLLAWQQSVLESLIGSDYS